MQRIWEYMTPTPEALIWGGFVSQCYILRKSYGHVSVLTFGYCSTSGRTLPVPAGSQSQCLVVKTCSYLSSSRSSVIASFFISSGGSSSPPTCTYTMGGGNTRHLELVGGGSHDERLSMTSKVPDRDGTYIYNDDISLLQH